MTDNQRDVSIDILRFIALTGIVLVHSQPNAFWAQIRQFDVPMMVFLSAICFTKPMKAVSYGSYILKRFLRLIIPTWCFLVIFFGIKYMIDNHLNTNEMLQTFFMTSNWYIWIIRVFFLISIIAPILFKLHLIVSWKYRVLILVTLLFINEFLANIFSGNYFATIIIMMIGYSIVFVVGIWLPSFTKKGLTLFCVSNALIYMVLGGGSVQAFKFPPRMMYLSYAFFCISLLWIFRQNIISWLKKCHLLTFCTYIGSHTLWIYLWHIPFVIFIGNKFSSPVRFIIIYACALTISFIQFFIVDKIIKLVIKSDKLKKQINMIFIS